jgi:hypothetical protein
MINTMENIQTRRDFLRTGGKAVAGLAGILAIPGCGFLQSPYQPIQIGSTAHYFKKYNEFMKQEVKYTNQEQSYLKIVHDRWGEEITVGEYLEKPDVPWLKEFKRKKGKNYVLSDKEMIFIFRNPALLKH